MDIGAIILLTTFVVLLLMNVPIAVCLGMSSVITFLVTGMSFNALPVNYFAANCKFVLLAIPFFILAGNIMEKAQISNKLIDFARTFVGHRQGGMSLVCVIVACFFAAISGSGPATVAALGMIIIPAMIDTGYAASSASALMATAGAIGVIIPPSISFVLYGSITNISVGKLFMAGIIPGIMMGIALVLAMKFAARGRKLKTLPKATKEERLAAFKSAIWALLMPVIILGGIYGGVFTPTEAAAVACVYGLLVGVFVYRTVRFKEFIRILVDSGRQTAVVMFIVCASSIFGYLVTINGVAATAGEFLTTVSGGNKIVFLLIVNIILLIVGCFLDGNSAFYIFTPILYPVAMKLGIDGVAFGVMMVMNLAIGMVTPPVGVNLYVACGMGNVSIKEICKGVVPFIVASLITLLLITYFPIFCTFLPNLMQG